MPSFDVVSKVSWAEVANALDQASREVAQRFDFKGIDTSLEKTESEIVVSSVSDERAKAAVDVLQQKLVRRKVSLKNVEVGDPTPGPKSTTRVTLKIKEGIEVEKAKEITKLLKGTKLKVQASIQEDRVRVSGKKKDDLQAAIQELKTQDFGVELQFENFRD
jgi:cyclic-di-GMP-binding protein